MTATVSMEEGSIKTFNVNIPKSSSSTALDILPFGVDNTRIELIRDVISPYKICTDMPLTERGLKTVLDSRKSIQDILEGHDDRVLVIVGPCSVHDPEAALEYGGQLLPVLRLLKNELVIIMRVYFEKPRTTVGWKGLINDPGLDNSFDINRGLQTARRLLVSLNDSGIPCATEFLDCLSPQYFCDCVSWGAIGARTVESQLHRELASGLSMPVGFKNGTTGNVDVAIEALKATQHQHCFLSVTKQGSVAIVKTRGNQNCHIVLRGGITGPNYSSIFVEKAVASALASGVCAKILIDCSHGNSSKIFKNQIKVCESVCQQLAADNETAPHILGVMIESNLIEGRQDYEPGTSEKTSLVYGKSITDGCLGLEDTIKLLELLAAACRTRRENRRLQKGNKPLLEGC